MCGFFNIKIEEEKELKKKENYPQIKVMIDEESFLNHPYDYRDIEEAEKKYIKISNENRRCLEELSLLFPHFNKHINWDSFDDLFTTLKAHNIFLEPNYERYIPKVFEMSQLYRKMIYSVPNMKRNLTSEAYKTIYKYMRLIMNSKNNNNNCPLFVTYSGHDTTLYTMLLVLNNKYEDMKPPYCSHIDIELYENIKNKEYYYKIYYEDELIENEKSDKDGFIPIKYFVGYEDENTSNNSFCCFSHKKKSK